MNRDIENYLSELKKELSGCDRATIQDALADAEEHLQTALDSAVSDEPNFDESRVMASIIEQYGPPAEIAAAYRETEAMDLAALPSAAGPETEQAGTPAEIKGEPQTRSPLGIFFGVVVQPRAWAAFFYLMISMATGIFYFSWVTTGISVSLGMMFLVIGLPLVGLFILSIRWLSLLEGRIVEALLGVRMPRRPVFRARNRGWWAYFKNTVKDERTWLSIIYMLVLMPLGIFYFCLFITFISLAGMGIAIPVAQIVFNTAFFNINGLDYFVVGWALPLAVIGGLLLLVALLHLAKALGHLHGQLARALLVRV